MLENLFSNSSNIFNKQKTECFTAQWKQRIFHFEKGLKEYPVNRINTSQLVPTEDQGPCRWCPLRATHRRQEPQVRVGTTRVSPSCDKHCPFLQKAEYRERPEGTGPSQRSAFPWGSPRCTYQRNVRIWGCVRCSLHMKVTWIPYTVKQPLLHINKVITYTSHH